MSNYTWIIVLVVIVWQVIAAIAQNAAKKQQREKMSDLAKARRGQSPPPGPQPTGATLQAPTSTSGSPLGGTAGARASDLAARRRAQLEELRRRRGAATRSAKTTLATQARVGPAAGPVPGRPQSAPLQSSSQQRRSKTIQSVKADFKSVRAAEDRSRQERVTEKQHGRDIQDAQRRREAIEEKERTRARQDTQRAQAEQGPHDQKDAYAERRRSPKSRQARFVRALGNIDTLRDLYILKEILDPPVALRPKSF